MTREHPPECICTACRRHVFLDRPRSLVCQLCGRPREHWAHGSTAAPPAPKPWAARLGSIKGSAKQ